MKKVLCVLAMFLLIVSAKAQNAFDYYTFNNDKGEIVINMENVLNPDLRFCMLSAIVNDSNLSYIIDDSKENSRLILSSNNLSFNEFKDYFSNIESKISKEFNDYTDADKDIRGEMFMEWKESLSEDLYAFLFRQMLMECPSTRDGNQTCATSDPFCTTDVITFHVEANPGGSCENGPYYGCLAPYIDRPPFWFHMKIGVAGAFTIRMTNSAQVDIDYCCWGPFDDPVSPCPSQLTQSKYIDCGSSGSATENCHIPSSAQVGKYYIMVITKYNQNTATNITFQKVANSGPGETDCGILPPLVANSGPYCAGETISLSGNAQAGASYTWTGPGGWTATGQNVTRPNSTLAMAGTYTCTITVGSQSSSATTEVEVYANPIADFNATTVCVGSTTQFTSTSTTNPSGQQITSYQWSFGDGGTSTQQNPSHTYANAGTYNVSLTVACGENTCINTSTKTVTVNDYPVANAGEDQNVSYQQTATLSAAPVSGATYSWRPANLIEGNANQQTVETIPMTESTTFTVTVTRNGCYDTDDVMIGVGEQMIANISGDNSVCQYESITLQTSVMGGSGNYSYQWKKNGSSVGGNSPTLTLNMPEAGTFTFTCEVSDGYSSYTASTTVIIRPLPNANAGADQDIFYDNYTTLEADFIEDAEYSWQPANMINGNADQRVVETVALTESTTFTLTVTKSECVNTDQVTINVGEEMTATATIDDAVICDGNSTTVHAIAVGGTPTNYQYTWQVTPYTATFDDYHTSETTIHPTQPGDYVITCTVDDGHTTINTQLNLTVNPAENEETRIAVCPSELPYILELPDGTTQSFNEGTGPDGWHTIVPNDFGCIVNVSLYLTVNSIVENTIIKSTCDEPYTFYDNGIAIKTLYQTCVFDTVYPYGDCEKHATIIFTRNSVYDENYQGEYVSENYPEHHCDSYTWPSNGQTYRRHGRYPYTFQSIHGCDSIVTLVLDEGNLSFEVNPGPSSAMAVDTCKNYEGCYIWGIEGQHTKIKASGMWSETFYEASSHGCDSVGYLNLRLYERPNIRTFNGDQQVQSGAIFMPYVYEYQVLNITGAGIDNNEHPLLPDDFTWTVLSYYDTPNRVHPNTDDHESTWQIGYPDSNDKSRILLYVNAEGNAVLRCTIHTICGEVSTEKFIYTEGYQEGQSVDEINYDNMVSVFPNPNNGELYIGYSQELTSEPLLISIYNYNGVLIDQLYSDTDNNVMHYSMGNMPNGMYFVRLTGKDFVITKKFVLSK